MVLAGRCSFSLAELKYEYPQEIVPVGETPASWLRKLTYEGVPKRFPGGLTEAYRKQIEDELAVIAELEYEAYFLTVADIVRWARDQKILCQGRGSAANSLVCYCLFVTEVDPRRATLLFGRFISVERNEPPDIDIDFEHQRREEVIQYIYRSTAAIVPRSPRSSSATGRARRCATPAVRSASTCSGSKRCRRASTGSTAAASPTSACARAASTPTRRSCACGWS
jgi:error-prone DNA polymerase